MSVEGDKKRKRNFYMAGNKKSRAGQHILAPGVNGFLVTCNFRERQAVMEAYNLLNEAKERLDVDDAAANDSPPTNGGGDVESELNAELAALKKERSFHQVQTNCKNTLFIKTYEIKWTPHQLMNSIWNDIDTNRTQKCRYICKFVPISSVVHATSGQIKQGVEQLLLKLEEDQSENVQYRIEMKVRCNSGVNKDKQIDLLGDLIKDMRPKWTVNLDNPHLVVYVDVLHKHAVLSILKDFNRYRKYNLLEYVTKIVGKDDQLKEEEEEQQKQSANDSSVHQNGDHQADNQKEEEEQEEQKNVSQVVA